MVAWERSRQAAAARGAARQALAAARRQRRRAGRPGRQAQQTIDLVALALGAAHLVAAEDEGLERVVAVLAGVLVQGHRSLLMSLVLLPSPPLRGRGEQEGPSRPPSLVNLA